MDINGAWKSTCRVLLGQEIGDLWGYERYLSRYVGSVDLRKSAISGEEVAIDAKYICKGAKFMGSGEVGEYEKMIGAKPFSINEIKDLDALVEAAAERAYYSGNVVSGNSSHVEKSSRCVDSQFIYGSYDIFNGRYVAYSCGVRLGEYMFGCNWVGETKFCICGHETYRDTRCMEMVRFYNCSDCYYSSCLEGCSDCIFTFNQKNVRHMIGNVRLEKGRYYELKEKLVAEMREALREKKMLPSIVDIINA